jgi:hypothetical protein
MAQLNRPMNKTVVVLVSILVAIAVVAILVGGYLGGWWLNKDVTNRQQHIDRQNYGTQLGYITSVQNKIADIHAIDVQIATANAEGKDALTAQKQAIVTQACHTASLITQKPDDIASFVSSHCE